MLYHLLYPLRDAFPVCNVLKYITFRSGASFVSSFFFSFLLWHWLKSFFLKLNLKESVDMYGHVHLEALHKSKKGTPTMGGIILIGAVCFSTLLWAKLTVSFVIYVLLIILLLGALGFCDDYLKVKRGRPLCRRDKLTVQILIGVFVGLVIFLDQNISTTLDVPFFKKAVVDLGAFYVFWATLVIVATSNAVNFTDGLDGLAIGGIITNSLVFAGLSYLSGHLKFAQYLFIPYIPDAGELTVICAALLGAGLAFLWYNSHPAEVFMGDTGALSLGGGIGVIALFIKKEFLLIIAGGIFVLEALSVVLQILSVRMRNKRVFRAAPLHHHFQLMGWPESKVIIRFWIISLICAVCALLTLKIR